MNQTPFPIRPTALLIKNFRGWVGQHELPIGPGLTLLVGDNASGKSSALNAIEWCLFGKEIARKGSGIDERADWEIRNRNAEDEVRVVLTLEVDNGTATLMRSRDVETLARDPDRVVLELPEDTELAGYEVDDWLGWTRMPDWTTWKHSFCQHQERPRVRVSDGRERSLQLGRLLGLEAFQEFSDAVKSLGFRDLEKVAKREMDGIEEDLRRALERPEAELRELEDRLERHDVARTDIGEGWVDERVRSLFEDAERLAKQVGFDAGVPAPDSRTPEDVLRWTNEQEPRVQGRRRELERDFGELRSRVQELEIALRAIEPSKRRVGDARGALQRFKREHGNRAALKAQGETLANERQALLEQERGRNATLALLRQALEETKRHGSRDSCPVCEQPSAGLGESLTRRMDAHGADDFAKRLDPIEARAKRVEEQRTELSRLQGELRAAEAEHDGLAERLRTWISGRESEDTSNPTQAAQARLESERREIEALEDRLRTIDDHVVALRSERAVFELLARWRTARARADAATGGLERISAWDDLQRALDDAAGLAGDLQVLGKIAREAQDRRSAERVGVVNTGLGRYYGLITGDPAGQGVRVRVKSTATRIDYRLVDTAGADITPILNQAALNALSFALLFAQAEDRARAGVPQWLVLDDPGQNLDDTNVSGLAEALIAVAEHCPVLLATFPGKLSLILEDGAPETVRIFRLAGSGATARIEEAQS